VSHVHALSALAGLTLVAAGLGGMMVWQSNTDADARAAAEARGEWMPPCAARLGPAYAAVAPTAQEDPGPPRTLLFGVDRSPSNLELSDEQMDAVTAHAATTPADTGVGVLLISDRSERSSTPDMPFEPAVARRGHVAGELPCAPTAPPTACLKRSASSRSTRRRRGGSRRWAPARRSGAPNCKSSGPSGSSAGASRCARGCRSRGRRCSGSGPRSPTCRSCGARRSG
jgi:hypothetical protein